MKVNAKALGYTFAVVKGTAVFLTTLFTEYMFGGATLSKLDRLFFGYTVTFKGACIGFVYGLAYGFIFGYLIAVLYNFFSKEK